MLTNNASFSVGIPAVFKRYYTVMCLKHLIFFIHPAVSYLSAIQHRVARRALHQ
jgi:hypothetical protein